MQKFRILLCITVAGVIGLTGCQKKNEEHLSAENPVQMMSETTDSSAENVSSDIQFRKSDINTEWDDSAVFVTLSGDSVTASPSNGVTINGTEILIQAENTYVFSGDLSDGRILVNMTNDTDKAHIVFNGASITSKTSAPLTVLNADKTILTLADETENFLTDAAEYTGNDNNAENVPNACLYAKDDVSINGKGTLNITGNYNNGILCKNDLKLIDCDIVVNAKNNGIRGDDSVIVKDASLQITAEGDGIRTETLDSDGKGVVTLDGGDVSITSSQDGIDSAVSFTMTSGSLQIKNGGGSVNAAKRSDFEDMRGGWGRMEQPATDNTDSVSTKGIKAGTSVQIQGGTIEIDSCDDALHSNDSLCVCGDAVLKLSAGDDGIHADNTLTISENANVTISESYEGMEAYSIHIDGGTTHINATDDGLNAAGDIQSDTQQKSDEEKQIPHGGFNMNSSGELFVSGGYLYVNAGGDGLDSNGDISISGGTTIVCGPTNDGNGPLDCGDHQNKITCSGGILMAVGSTGMMEAPEENYIGTASLNAPADTLIVVTDDNGLVLGALQTPKEAQGIVFSANGMADGYHVYTGGTLEQSLNDDGWTTGGSFTGGTEITSGSGGVVGGFGGFGGGHMPDHDSRGGKPEGMPEPPNGDVPRQPNGGRPDGVPEMPSHGFDGAVPSNGLGRFLS